MEFLPGFAWPIPRAFAAAVSNGRFEQGDVFFDASAAYEAWGADGPGGVRCWLQVLDPPRGARTAPSDAEGDRFAANWVSPVTVERGAPDGTDPTTVRCTQGRLFTCLWRGDLDQLVEAPPDAGDDPQLPRFGRELQRELEAAVPALTRALGRSRWGLLFASVRDAASESSLAKARSIHAALSSRYEPVTVSLAPSEAGVPEGDTYHPALRVSAVAVREDDPDRVRELLKPVLYGGSGQAGESGGDRFKLERHGLLVERKAENDASGDSS